MYVLFLNNLFLVVHNAFFRRNSIYNTFHENTSLRLLFCASTIIHLYEFQINNFSKHFYVNSIRFEFVSKEKFSFNDFFFFFFFFFNQYFKYLKYEVKYARVEGIFPYVSFLKRLQAIDPSFVTITITLENKIVGTFGKGLV